MQSLQELPIDKEKDHTCPEACAIDSEIPYMRASRSTSNFI